MLPVCPVTGSGLGSILTFGGSFRQGWMVVADAAASDLRQQRAAVMRVLLHDAVAVPGDPDVVLVVDVEAMNALRHSALRQMAPRAPVTADRIDGSGPPRRGGRR